MQRLQVLILLFMMILPALGYSQPTCVASALSDQQIKDIIDEERATRKDLPAPFPEYEWHVEKRECYYLYFETDNPRAFDSDRIFRLNQYGVIVDVTMGSALTTGLKCPEKVFTENELAEIVKKERGKRHDLPPLFPSYKTRVDRLRCLYLYFEYALPKTRENSRVFIIDPLGELIEVFRN